MRRKIEAMLWNDLHPNDPPRPGLIILDMPSKAGDGKQYISCACGGEDADKLDETARRIIALWNTAEERGWTTEDIEVGIITPDVETRRIVGRLSDQYENLSKQYSQRGETIVRLRAERTKMLRALEAVTGDSEESDYMMQSQIQKLCRDAIKKARGES